jgi:hypothetical protein
MTTNRAERSDLPFLAGSYFRSLSIVARSKAPVGWIVISGSTAIG